MTGREYDDNLCPGAASCTDDWCTDHGKRNVRSPRYMPPVAPPAASREPALRVAQKAGT